MRVRLSTSGAAPTLGLPVDALLPLAAEPGINRGLDEPDRRKGVRGEADATDRGDDDAAASVIAPDENARGD